MGMVPEHIAIIMDGNGRWANGRGLPRAAGHRAGVENIRRIVLLSYGWITSIRGSGTDILASWLSGISEP